MAGAGEDRGDAGSFVRQSLPPSRFPGGSPGLPPEGRADLEQPDVPVPVGPVVLDQADEAGEDAGAPARVLPPDPAVAPGNAPSHPSPPPARHITRTHVLTS